MSGLDLLDIPWFAFDIPEYGTPNRKSASQKLSVPSAISQFTLGGWESAEDVPSSQLVLLQKPSMRQKAAGTQSTNSSNHTNYHFKHYKDIAQYMKDYRSYHTCKQTGVVGSLMQQVKMSPCLGRSGEPTSVEQKDGLLSAGSDYNKEGATSGSNSGLIQSELMHILRHSQSKKLRDPSYRPVHMPVRAQYYDIEDEQEEEQEEESTGINVSTNWRLPHNKLLPHRASSSSSVHSSEALNNKTSCKSNKSLSAGQERPSQAGQERPSQAGLERPSQAGLERPSRYDKVKTESSLVNKKPVNQTVTQQLLANQRQHMSALYYPIPGSKVFVGSTMRRTPQNGLSSASNQRGGNGILSQFKAAPSRKLYDSTHSTISSLKHQVWFDEQGRAYLSLANHLNSLFKSYKHQRI